MDAVAKNGEVIAYAISEHIEFAGVHSGDATIQFPPQKLYVETVRRVKRVGRQIAERFTLKRPNGEEIQSSRSRVIHIPNAF